MMDLLDVVEVKACDGYTLELVFENGERRLFDMNPLLEKTFFQTEGDGRIFWRAHRLRHCRLAWQYRHRT